MRYVLFTIAFITFFSAPDSLDKGVGAWIALAASAAYMIWMIRKEKNRRHYINEKPRRAATRSGAEQIAYVVIIPRRDK